MKGRIILDPNIYELTNSQALNETEVFKHYNYFLAIVNFIKEKNGMMIITEKQIEAVSNINNHPWDQYLNGTQRNAIINLYSIFFGAIDYSKTFDDNEPAIDDQSLNHRSKNCYIEFLKQITEVIKNSNKYSVC